METLSLDKFVRTIGVPAYARYHFERIDQTELDMLNNYAAGVNEAYKQTKLMQSEFWLTMTDFEPWTPYDTICYWYLETLFMSGDWFFEIVRERMTEVYDRTLVDGMIPFNSDNFFKHSK